MNKKRPSLFNHLQSDYYVQMRKEAIERLEARAGNQPDRSLKRIRKAWKLLNIDPFPIIHVAGTNGKGSVANGIFFILSNLGYDVGLYTSPHLVRYGERIQTNAGEISLEILVRHLQHIEELEEMIQDQYGTFTYFEMLTLAAARYFSERELDLVIMEAGVGGRFDATKGIPGGFAYLITSIGLDHQSYLGDTLESVAHHKAGIFGKGCAATLNKGEVLSVIEKEAKRHEGLTLYGPDAFRFFHDGKEIPITAIPQKGEFSVEFLQQTFHVDPLQIGSIRGENTALALAGSLFALDFLGKDLGVISKATMELALSYSHWPGRMDILHEKPLVLVDGAHNEDAIHKLMISMKQIPYKKLHTIYAVMNTKDHSTLSSRLREQSDYLYVTTNGDEKSVELDQLAQEAKADKAIEDPWDAVEYAMAKADLEDCILITGSLYLVGSILEDKSKFELFDEE